MIMFQGDTGIRGFLMRFISDHPINTQRIDNLRRLIPHYCGEHPSPCRVSIGASP
jgi:hypothetical protein